MKQVTHLENNITLYQYLKVFAAINDLSMLDVSKYMNISMKTMYNIKDEQPSLNTYKKIAKGYTGDMFDLMKLKIN